MTLLALVRPDSWNFPLLLHIGGAMILVGGVLTAASALVVARGDVALLRLGYRALLIVGLPGYIVMRASAEWIADKEGYSDLSSPPSWIDVGYIAGDAGLLLIIISSLLGYFSLRRARAAEGEGGRPSGMVRAAATLLSLLLLVNLVALWAMTTKPT